MGDRANIKIQSDGNSELYFYTHWNAYKLPKTLQDALKRKLRWNDESYLNRIIFCEMVKDVENRETGFGISTVLCDGSDRIITVNPDKNTVEIQGKVWTFNEYIECDVEKIQF